MVLQIRRCLEMIPRHLWWSWGFSMLSSLVTGGLETLSATIVFALVTVVNDPEQIHRLPVLSRVSAFLPASDPHQFVIGFALIAAVFYVFKAILLVWTSYQNRLVLGHADSSLASMFFRAYLKAPYAFFFRRNSADLIHQVSTGVASILGGTLGAAVLLTSEVLVTGGLVAVMLASAPLLTILVGSFVIGALWGMLRLTRADMLRSGAEAHRLGSVVLQSVQQGLGAVKEVKVLGREEYFLRVYVDGMEAAIRANVRRGILDTVPRLMTEAIFAAGGLFVVAAVTISGGKASDAIPLLSLYAYSAFRLMPASNRIYMQLNEIRWRSEPVERLYEDYRTLIAGESEWKGDAEAAHAEPLRDDIVLEDVSFRYAPDDEFALRNLDLTIHRGESIGIVGPTGAGKSTLVDLLIGLLDPISGSITTDGVDLRRRRRSWQSRIGYVPQEIYLIDDSLRRNIALGVADLEIDENRVREAVRMAQIDEFVSSLGEGLDTFVGERGIRLSGGQRQRVGIARALYHQPDVLIFDEATSSLDNATEAEIVKAIEALHGVKTMLVIAHRLSTVRHCDRLVFLHGGRVMGCGTYSDLLASNPEFRRMAQPERAEGTADREVARPAPSG